MKPVPSSSRIDSSGVIQRLDRPAAPKEIVTEADVSDPKKLAELLGRLVNAVTDIRRRWSPRRIDFEDIVVDGTSVTQYRFEHRFNGRVRWYAVEWAAVGTGGPGLYTVSGYGDANTLILVSSNAGTVTLRVEEVG